VFPIFTLINIMKTLSDNRSLKINHSTVNTVTSAASENRLPISNNNFPGPESSKCDAWAMIKVARHNYDQNTKSEKRNTII